MFHIGKQGPSECRAQVKCPFESEHFDSLEKAYDFFEKTQNSLPEVFGKRKIFSESKVMKNSYIGSTIYEKDISQYILEWKNIVGDDNAKVMEEFKILRDNGRSFHMTVLEPKEYRNLRKQGIKIPEHVIDVTVTGVSSVKNDTAEAWYLTCDSKVGDELRQKLGLAPKHFHITLGFINNDIHDQPKI